MRCVAFLKAINVGGHVVKMDRLRHLFDAMGFGGVETFIASGNVLFDTSARSHATLERTIEAGLREALGYDVPTFIRTGADVKAVAAYEPWPPDVAAKAAALNVGFLHLPPDAAARRAVLALQTEIDEFHVHGREVYWKCQARQSESKVTGATLEKALGARCTVRGLKTVMKLAARL